MIAGSAAAQGSVARYTTDGPRWHRVGTPLSAATSSLEDYAATIFSQIGVDPNKTLITPGGRPQSIVKDGKVVKELLA